MRISVNEKSMTWGGVCLRCRVDNEWYVVAKVEMEIVTVFLDNYYSVSGRSSESL